VRSVIDVLHNRPILVSPTGSGKTVMATELVERIGLPTLWLAHRQELIEQAARRLEAYGLFTGIIKAGYPAAPLAQVQVASVQTLVRRDMPRAGLVVIDECHHATATTYRDILDRVAEVNPGVAVVGLTATPFRLDGSGLGDIFHSLVVASSTADLCDAGILHRPKVWAAKSPDLRGIRVLGGDYNLGALSKRTNTKTANADIVSTWRKHADGLRTVCFAVDVEHSEAIVAAFQLEGIKAEHLDGTMDNETRSAILAHLASGKTQIVSNCMVLTEGWDLPALQCAILARPTASLNLHLQMVGRVMRAADGKQGAIVLDHAGNHHVHGLVTRRLEYSLDGSTRVGTSEPLGLRRCRQCGLFFELTTFACPDCGYKPSAADTPARERPSVHGGGELSEFDDSRFDYRLEVWNLIEAEREANGFKPGWSTFRFRERFGVDPIVLNGELVDPAAATMEQKEAVYAEFVRVASEKGFKLGWASWRFKDSFGCWPRGFVSKVRGDGVAGKDIRQRVNDALKTHAEAAT
jgi:superfamily II DNA or RNA helicase